MDFGDGGAYEGGASPGATARNPQLAAMDASGLITAALEQQVPLDEPDVELLRNFGEHKLMARVQAALTKQLQAALDRVEEELSDQSEARERAKREREQVGVELYGVQQQLARLQTQLDTTSRNVELLHDIRVKTEAELRVYQDGYAAKKAAIEAEEERLRRANGELDGLGESLRQVEGYLRDMDAEAALSKRASSKADEEVRNKENAKLAQDMYIDHLVSALKRSTEEATLYQEQIDAQKAQTAAAGSTMGEAAAEMEVLRVEKRELQSQYNSAQVAIKKRDVAYSALTKATSEQFEALNSMEAEEANVAKGVFKAQEMHARIQSAVDREENNLRTMDATINELRAEMAALEERRAELQETLDAAELAVSRAHVEKTKLEKALRETDRERLLLDKQRHGFENQMAELHNERTTSEKATQSLLRDARKLIDRLHETDLACSETENRIATAKVEALSLSAVVTGLREQLTAAEGEVREKERLVDRFEAEIKQREDAIAKKQATVDRLNRKFEALVAAQPEAANMGPLQAEVHNLTRDIAAKREEIAALQKFWLTDQASAVAAANDADAKASRVKELTSQAALLEAKRARLDADIADQEAEGRRLRNAVVTMREDITRIGALIAKNSSLASKLAASTSASEIAFSEELKALGKEAAELDAKIAALRAEKEALVADLVECERQIVLWEKKIELEKAAQAAIDPSVGEAEIGQMEREVGRMKARRDALKREQERLVNELEKAVEKQESIAIKHRSQDSLALSAKAAGTKTKGSAVAAAANAEAATRVALKHKATTLKEEIAKRLAQAQEVEAALAARRTEVSDLAAEVDALGGKAAELEERAAATQRAVHAALYDKQRGMEAVSALTRLIQRLEAVDGGRMPSITPDEAAKVGARIEEAVAARESVGRLLDTLSAAHHDLGEVLGRVKLLLSIAPDAVLDTPLQELAAAAGAARA